MLSSWPRRSALAVLTVAALTASACGADDPSPGAAAKPKVVATTTVLGDLVREVAGDHADVVQILKPNSDAHEYEPRPQDVLDAGDAALVVESGDNLDRWMKDVVAQSGSDAAVLDVSEELRIRRPGESEGAEASKYDPHWWHDPRTRRLPCARSATPS